tara:strand:- start:523 stop:723 length:201 start_codon:yes stop_codon:yes gene_type:complete
MPRKAGIIETDKGIKNLKLSSKVSEIDIQYKLLKKYPNPKNQPYKNNFKKLRFVLIASNTKIKKNV